VYENKGNRDKVADEKSDIYVDMTRLLQKEAAYDRLRMAHFRVTVIRRIQRKCGMESAKISPGQICRRARQFPLLLFWLLACTLRAVPSEVPDLPEPLELLKQLNGVTIDSTKIYVIRDGHLTRTRMDLYLNRGFVAFMTPVQGQITGAVFWGDGEVLMIPPDRAEKRNLAQFTRAPILEEKFDAAYLRFTDQTAQELQAALRPPDPDDLEQPGPFLSE